MSQPLRLGIAGLGTVGTGVVKIVRQKANLLSMRAGRPIEITAVSARSGMVTVRLPDAIYAASRTIPDCTPSLLRPLVLWSSRLDSNRGRSTPG